MFRSIFKIEMKKSRNLSEKFDRKTIERNRRTHMKGLCFKLTSIIPPHHFKPSKDLITQQEQLDQAAVYIKQLKDKIDELKEKKEAIMEEEDDTMNNNSVLKLPIFEFRELGSILEVIVISGLEMKFMLYKAIHVLDEEGADVVSAHFATVEDKVFYTIHAQVRVSRVGVDTSRICERLEEIIY